MPIKDSLIAATALTHDLIMATCNSPDFRESRSADRRSVRCSAVVAPTLVAP
jgi:predicted nucleic acid-binding protein